MEQCDPLLFHGSSKKFETFMRLHQRASYFKEENWVFAFTETQAYALCIATGAARNATEDEASRMASKVEQCGYHEHQL